MFPARLDALVLARPSGKASPARGAGVASRHFLRHQRHHPCRWPAPAAGAGRYPDCRRRSCPQPPAGHRIAGGPARRASPGPPPPGKRCCGTICSASAAGRTAPVADKARAARLSTTASSAGGAKVAHPCQMRQRGAPGHHFHQRDQVRRMPEMGDQQPFRWRMPCASRSGGRPLCAGDNRLVGDQRFQLGV